MNQLEKQVLYIIGENVDSPDVFTDDSTGMAQIRDSINDAIQEICAVTGSVNRTYYVPIESSTFYRIKLEKNQVAWITDAFLVNKGIRLKQTDYQKLFALDPRWLEVTGTPFEYLHIGTDVVGLYPRPTDTSEMLELRLVIIPGRYTLDSDRVFVRKNFQWATVHYAVSEYWASRGDAKEAVKYFQRYLQDLGMQQYYPLSDRSYRFRTDSKQEISN